MAQSEIEGSGVPLGERLEMFGSVAALGGLLLLTADKLVDSGIKLPTIIEVPVRTLGVVATAGGTISIFGGIIHDIATGRTFHNNT